MPRSLSNLIGNNYLLLIIDVQIDFCPGGRLAIIDGDAVVPLINRLIPNFRHVILTQDWHTPNHHSFASSHPGHPGKQPYESIVTSYGSQTLWPDHCVQGTPGAAFHPDLNTTRAELILRKGFHLEIDSYSAFLENDHTTPTGLAGYLRERNLTRIFLAGLAYDFCVRFSAVDGKRLGFETIVIQDACRSVNLPGTVASAKADFAALNIPQIDSAELLSDDT